MKDIKTYLKDSNKLYWKDFLSRLKDCREEMTEDRIHDLRISVRRLIVFITTIHKMAPLFSFINMRNDLKNLFNEFSHLRDIQVHAGIIQNLLEQNTELTDFYQYLRELEKQLHHDLSEKLINIDPAFYQNYRKKLKKQITFMADNYSDKVLMTGLKNTLHNSYTGLILKLPTLTPPQLHRFRIRLKEVRFTAELFIPVDKKYAKACDVFREFQTMLGLIHDYELMVIELEEFIRLNPGTEQELSGCLDYLKKTLNEMIVNFFETSHELTKQNITG